MLHILNECFSCYELTKQFFCVTTSGKKKSNERKIRIKE